MRQKGGSAIELLVAMVILSLMLLAATTIYLRSMKQLQNTRTENFINEQVEVATQSLLAGDSQFIPAWQQHIATRLPQGHAEIHQSAGLYWLTISWFDRWEASQKSRIYSVIIL